MRASDSAYRVLLDDIQSGALAPGATIAEIEQSDRLGVGRTPVREAVRKLMADGMIVQVSPRVHEVAGFDADDIRDMFAARSALERATVRAAALHGNPAEFWRLAEAFQVAQPDSGEASVREYYELIDTFDRAIDRAANNRYLSSGLRIVRQHLVRARRLAMHKPTRLTQSVEEHALIARAIARRDAELASNALQVHLHNALESILSSLQNSSSEGQQ